jgi:hypothetical protein
MDNIASKSKLGKRVLSICTRVELGKCMNRIDRLGFPANKSRFMQIEPCFIQIEAEFGRFIHCTRNTVYGIYPKFYPANYYFVLY